LANWIRSKIGEEKWSLDIAEAFHASKLTGSLLGQVPLTSVDDVSKYIPNIPPSTAEAIWRTFHEHILDLTQSLEKFIIDTQKACSPLSKASQCSICKLPLEPKNIKTLPREALKYSVDTALTRHWFCLPDESIFN
jgi:hypothetical protein